MCSQSDSLTDKDLVASKHLYQNVVRFKLAQSPSHDPRERYPRNSYAMPLYKYPCHTEVNVFTRHHHGRWVANNGRDLRNR